MPTPTWPPPPPPPPAPPGPGGWSLGADGCWQHTIAPPGPGYWLASDRRWYPPGSEDQGWRSSRWGLGDAALAVPILIVANIVLLGAALAIGGDIDSPDAYVIALFVVANVIGFAGVPWWASRTKGLGSLRDDFGLSFRWRDLGIGLGLGFVALILGGIAGTTVDAVLGAQESTSNIPVDNLASPGEFIAFLVAIAIVTPIIEEIFFRGLVYRSLLKQGRSPTAAIVWTTVIFAVPHLSAVSDWRALVSLLVSITVIGAVFNLAVHWNELRLGPAIIAHAVVNGTAVIALYLIDTPGV